MGRKEMARYFWEVCPEPLSCAIQCACVFHGLERYVPREMEDDMKVYAKEFEELAAGLIKYCFEEDISRSVQAVEMEYDLDSRLMLVDLAFLSECDDIIQTTCCQIAIRKRWAGSLRHNTPLAILLFGLVFPVAIPMIGATYGAKGDNSLQLTLRSKRTFSFNSYASYYSTPGIKFLSNALMYFAMCVLWAQVTLSSFPSSLSLREIVLFVWMSAQIVEETVQLVGLGVSEWWKSGWNKLDCCIYLLYIVAFSIRLVDITDPSYEDAKAYDDTVLTKKLMGVGMVLCCTRVLSSFTISPVVGPLLVTIKRMITDISAFLVIFVIYMMGFGVTFQSLMDPLNWNAGTTTKLVGNIMESAYFTAYGDLFLLQESDATLFKWMVALYLVVSNI
eukprot:Rmarinus@m.26812